MNFTMIASQFEEKLENNQCTYQRKRERDVDGVPDRDQKTMEKKMKKKKVRKRNWLSFL